MGGRQSAADFRISYRDVANRQYVIRMVFAIDAGVTLLAPDTTVTPEIAQVGLTEIQIEPSPGWRD
jgi:hypothetical protein